MSKMTSPSLALSGSQFSFMVVMSLETILRAICFLLRAYFMTIGPGSFQLACRPMELSTSPFITARASNVTLQECQVTKYANSINLTPSAGLIFLASTAMGKLLAMTSFSHAKDLAYVGA